ncbi:MAG: tRNA (adenine(22)-N(1))-methyltransferase [Eubacteriaceae bacterium]
MMSRLSPRLKTIADCVTDVSSFADIGTDHGYIPVYLIENKGVDFGIACDINQKPLEKAENLIKVYGYENQIETRLGSGLSVLKENEVDAIILAGMGGILISELLEEQLAIAFSAKKLIFQPMNNQKILRKYCEERGFQIVKEELAIEGTRIYEIIVAQKGKMIFENSLEYELGHQFLTKKHPLLETLVRVKLGKAQLILESTNAKNTTEAKEKNSECRKYIKDLNEVLKCL